MKTKRDPASCRNTAPPTSASTAASRRSSAATCINDSRAIAPAHAIRPPLYAVDDVRPSRCAPTPLEKALARPVFAGPRFEDCDEVHPGLAGAAVAELARAAGVPVKRYASMTSAQIAVDADVDLCACGHVRGAHSPDRNTPNGPCSHCQCPRFVDITDSITMPRMLAKLARSERHYLFHVFADGHGQEVLGRKTFRADEAARLVDDLKCHGYGALHVRLWSPSLLAADVWHASWGYASTSTKTTPADAFPVDELPIENPRDAYGVDAHSRPLDDGADMRIDALGYALAEPWGEFRPESCAMWIERAPERDELDGQLRRLDDLLERTERAGHAKKVGHE